MSVTFRCQACDFETVVVYDAACHGYALGGDHHTTVVVAQAMAKQVADTWYPTCPCGWVGPCGYAICENALYEAEKHQKASHG